MNRKTENNKENIGNTHHVKNITVPAKDVVVYGGTEFTEIHRVVLIYIHHAPL